MSFHYNLNGIQEFHCNLQCMRCVAINRTGQQCSRRTCKHLAMCYQHIKNLGLEIKTSSIPGAGFGLFALVDIPKGAQIAEYFGELLTRDQIDERYGGDLGIAPYAVKLRARGLYVDSACRRSLASYINGASRDYPANSVFVNSTPTTINIRAARGIRAGNEIIVSYGREYFRNIDNHTHETLRRKILSSEKFL